MIIQRHDSRGYLMDFGKLCRAAVDSAHLLCDTYDKDGIDNGTEFSKLGATALSAFAGVRESLLCCDCDALAGRQHRLAVAVLELQDKIAAVGRLGGIYALRLPTLFMRYCAHKMRDICVMLEEYLQLGGGKFNPVLAAEITAGCKQLHDECTIQVFSLWKRERSTIDALIMKDMLEEFMGVADEIVTVLKYTGMRESAVG
ncbi:MAG: hypothetical protein FWB93_02340 [Oscillospiraceae bacterium]|nr:hypothetical protein [Oscillospiraceae bacterium]